MEQVKARVRDIPDFPKPGILFKDITPVLNDPDTFRRVIDSLVERYRAAGIDQVVGIESRGFIFGAPLAHLLGAGFVPVRKPGKLPAAVDRVEYALEYGSDALEIHRDAISPGSRVLIVDDLLATGGTASAAAELVERQGGVVHELVFAIELLFLAGRERLGGRPVHSLLQY